MTTSRKIHTFYRKPMTRPQAVALVCCLGLLLCVSPARAGVTWSGDLDPSNPLTWTLSTRAYIGETGVGTLSITGGSDISCDDGTVGRTSGSSGTVSVNGAGSTWTVDDTLALSDWGDGALDITNGGSLSTGRAKIAGGRDVSGTVTVDGVGSSWVNDGFLWVGSGGTGSTGILSIANGGSVVVDGDTWVSRYNDSSGTINFDNTTLTTGGLVCNFSDLAGTGTIDTHGLVSDVDLVFDATHGLSQTFILNTEPGQNVTVNLDVDGTAAMGAGFGGTGTMTITDGRTVSSTEGHIGRKSGSDGTVTVDGVGSSWTTSVNIDVAYYGTGELNITDGGTVNDVRGHIGYEAGSDGTVNVDGAGSSWINSDRLYLGIRGAGALNITNGGTVSCTDGYLGEQSGGTATVTVDGAGSIWTNSEDLALGRIGDGSSGTVTVTNGGTVSSATGYVGYNADGGTATIDGAGSLWTNSGDFFVGYRATGELTVTQGGAVSSASSIISYGDGESGTVTIDGAGSTWTSSGDLTVGLDGQAELNITGGGAVSSAAGYIGSGSGFSGTVTVEGAGSSWTNTGGVHVATSHAGNMFVNDGATVSGSDGYIGYGAGSSALVIVTGADSSWMNSGDFHVGYDGNGVLRITDEGLVSVAGAMSIDAHSGLGGQVKIRSGGMLALAGDADGSLLEFLGLVGGTDDILYWDRAGGVWGDIDDAIYGTDYILTYLTEGDLAGYTMLTVDGEWSVPAGDLDGDGDTDADDVDLLSANFGGDPGTYDMDGDGDVDADDMTYLVETYLEYDSNGDGTPDGQGTYRGDSNTDGTVNGTDLSIMNASFGSSVGFAGGNTNGDSTVNGTDLSILAGDFGNVATAPVPEPATMGLLSLGGLALLRRKK